MNSASSVFLFVIIAWGLTSTEVAIAQSAGHQVGLVSSEQIIEHDRIFRIYMDRYEPNEEAVTYLSTQKDSLTLYVFFGNWCRESKKYIPGLMKSLQAAGSELIEARYIGVDVQKKNPKKFLNKFDIKYIPTVVVLKGNIEIGRIVEKPEQPIETDLVQILKRHQ